ncbi:NUDIX hydrolase [Lysinibacillus sp. NPDC056185]|uniref:NUDIX hydrolase n=1 Tax=Lysinibacillus sp. NPDC056185 TaxID=3345739 RepID=UPI0039EEF301
MGYISELRKLIGSRPIISIGATILVINDDKKILFQHRSDTLDWGLPGGSMELNETLEEVACRELYEETGLVANEFDLIGVFSGPDYYFQYPNGDEVYTVIHLYVAKNVSGVLEKKDDESLNLTYFGENELPDNMEKRTKNLLENLEDKLWDLGSSFANNNRNFSK